jgi:glycosyltransferase involved in cell wall biosynthesis
MYPTYPPCNGGAIRVHQLAAACSSAFDVTYYAQSAHPRRLLVPHRSEISPSYREVQAIDALSFAADLAGRFIALPQLAQSRTFSIAAPRWLRDAARDAAIITIEQPWQFAWASAARGASTKIVYDAHNVEADMFDVETIRLPRPVASRILAAVRRQERRAAQGADCVLVTSEDDAARMRILHGVSARKVHVIPNGVDCTRIRPARPEERRESKAALGLSGKHVVLFCGAKHPPNRGAVETMLGWARAWRGREIHIVVVGSVGEWFSGVRDPDVTITGTVADVRSYYRAADVMVNPVTAGGGTNVKQLEYLASGVASVTTKFGARGTGIRDGYEGIICDVDAMQEAVTRLLANRSTRRAIGAHGRALAIREFDWSAIGERLVSLYQEL